jgi:hypothetical protein
MDSASGLDRRDRPAALGFWKRFCVSRQNVADSKRTRRRAGPRRSLSASESPGWISSARNGNQEGFADDARGNLSFFALRLIRGFLSRSTCSHPLFQQNVPAPPLAKQLPGCGFRRGSEKLLQVCGIVNVDRNPGELKHDARFAGGLRGSVRWGLKLSLPKRRGNRFAGRRKAALVPRPSAAGTSTLPSRARACATICRVRSA